MIYGVVVADHDGSIGDDFHGDTDAHYIDDDVNNNNDAYNGIHYHQYYLRRSEVHFTSVSRLHLYDKKR